MIIQTKDEEKRAYFLAYNDLVMGKLENFLSGTRILEEIESPINGKLTVVSDLAWGVHIKGGGLTQSGGVAEKVWHTSLKEAKKIKKNVKACLVLGLGGGGVLRAIKRFWPKSVITGVEIDPIMIKLGTKHMKLEESGAEIVIGDAMKFVKEQIEKKKKYDLILIDMYVGDTIPGKFVTPAFYTLIKKLLEKDGTTVVNRLYYGEKRKLSDKTLQDLKDIFSKIIPVYPEANVMFICS